METQNLFEQSYNNATQLHHKYNNYETLANIEYIKHLIEKINDLKKQNREITLNYNQVIFDFANYRAEVEDKEVNTKEKEEKNEKDEDLIIHDAIDIY
jgi:hypothetical protein